jgi:thioredoxin reductase (NADPH)
LEKDPGDTLVVGGGYIAVECAGFLCGLGKRVHLLNRSTFLRSMDSDFADRVVEQLEEEGVRTHTQSKVLEVEATDDGRKKVVIQTGEKTKKITVDTILVAIGRDCNPAGIMVDKAGVKYNQQSNKIIGRKEEKERTNIDHIYAVGDILQDVPELMPVAQQAGKLLAHRIKERRITDDMPPESIVLKNYTTDYRLIPTTVFSPTEYSFVGVSEQEAYDEYGEDNIEVYHKETIPLSGAIYSENTKIAYMKVITLKTESERVVGMHYFGPAADEVIQGFAVAMKLGMRKADLDNSIGVHPSVGEDFFNLDATKRNGKEFRKTDC